MAKPTPLVTSSESQALREALGEARDALGSEGDVQRLRAKLGELPPVAATGTSGAVQATGFGVKAAALTATAVLIIAAALAYVPREREVAAPKRAPAAASVAPTAAPATPPEPAPAIEPPQVPVAPVASKIARSKAAPVPQAPAPGAAAETGPKELELLMSAQDALDASPQRALGLLDQHAQRYPGGSFALEREALAIDALRKLGRITAAQARARAFVARFPNAPGTKRLQSWLDESAAPDHKTETQPLPTR